MAEYLASGVNSALSKNEQLTLTIQVLMMLSNYIKTLGIPVTLNTIVTHFSCLPHAVDVCFPSYKDARLLRYIIAPQPLRA